LKKNIVLIDLENVQPKKLGILKDHDFKVYVFVGANQTKIPFDLVSTMQSLNENAEYIKIDGNGPNALDFHIAYYIGKISAENKNTFFHIISKDTGFDPLIKHLKSNKIHVLRHKTVSSIPILQLSTSKTKAEKIETIVEFLKDRGNAKPRTVKTLKNALKSSFTSSIEDSELDKLINCLISQKHISETDGKITYKL
jgi:PIN domain-containing protein